VTRGTNCFFCNFLKFLVEIVEVLFVISYFFWISMQFCTSAYPQRKKMYFQVLLNLAVKGGGRGGGGVMGGNFSGWFKWPLATNDEPNCAVVLFSFLVPTNTKK
jgi:hypothetical protein